MTTSSGREKMQLNAHPKERITTLAAEIAALIVSIIPIVVTNDTDEKEIEACIIAVTDAFKQAIKEEKNTITDAFKQAIKEEKNAIKCTANRD
jgi:hypothetical protein